MMKQWTTFLKTRRGLIFLAAALLAMLVAWAVTLVCQPVSSRQEAVCIYIGDHDTPFSVYDQLGKATGSQALGVRLLGAVTGFKPRSGRYEIAPDESALTVFRHLRNGSQTPLRLVLRPSRTKRQLANQVADKLMLEADDLYQRLNDASVCQALGFDTATVMALFIPDTYEVYWNIAPDKFLQRMKREYDAYWTAERRQLAADNGLTPTEVATLASIVDEETANNAEKPLIAALYLNRLRRGMPLQADPTVKFALQDFGLRRILGKHLEVDSPYNTYRHQGLPPGPIRMASRVALEAVLHHAEHNYIYMCAKEDFSGTHNYVATYPEHQANARRYIKALNARGIK